MMDINAAIDNICNKIGTTADILVPELARYKEYSYLAGVTVCIICIVVCIGLILIGKKLHEKRCDEEDYMGFYFFGGLGLLISLAVFMTHIHGYIVWHNAPMGASVNYILNSLGK